MLSNHRDREFHINQEPFYREIKPTKGDGIPAASARVQALSAHKNTHNEYQYDRLLPMIAKPTAEATPRLQELARYDNSHIPPTITHTIP